MITSALRWFVADARRPQIAVLASLVVYGAWFRDFILAPLALPAAIGTALLVEGISFRFRRNGAVGRAPYPSAMISALSTILLFRSTETWAYAAVAGFAVLSKVLFRYRGRHFINPTNGAVLLGSVLFPGWIASGQWGHETVLIFVLAAGASLTLTRAGRLDTGLAFLGSVAGLQILRHYVVGVSWPAVLHLLQNGAFWLFALYMITDPKTTPQARWARFLHAFLVAALALGLTQFFYIRDGFLWALLILAPGVILLDHIQPVPPLPSYGGIHVQAAPSR